MRENMGLFGAEPEWHFVDPETVGEFTGLFDRNGKRTKEQSCRSGRRKTMCESTMERGV